jgi:hypothetical protein
LLLPLRFIATFTEVVPKFVRKITRTQEQCVLPVLLSHVVYDLIDARELFRSHRLTAPEEVKREIEKALRSAERIVAELGGTISKIEFAPQATEEEILAAFVENGSFDVLRLDPETKKAKKLK